jgi:hypothetical protein
MLDDARARGSIMGYVGGLTYRALAALRRGAVDVAASDAARALELGQEHELRFALPCTVQILVEALLEKGEVEQCSRRCPRWSSHLWMARSPVRCSSRPVAG